MCRALSAGGRRCPCSNPERERARKRAYRAAQAATTTSPPEDTDTGDAHEPAPRPATVTREDVTARVSAAQEVIAAGEGETRQIEVEGEVITLPGRRTPMVGSDGDGWTQATDYGRQGEVAIRDAGAAIHERAQQHLDFDPETLDNVIALKEQGYPASTREEYEESVAQASERANTEGMRLHEIILDEDAADADRSAAQEQQPKVTADTKRWNRERIALQDGESQWDRAESYAWARAYRETLTEQRPMGLAEEADFPLEADSPHGAEKVFRTVWKNYPRGWVERERDALSPMRVVIDPTQRAEYVHNAPGPGEMPGMASQMTLNSTNSDTTDEDERTEITVVATHEYGHRAEATNRQINDVCQAFLARRTTGEDGRRHPLENLRFTVEDPPRNAQELQSAGGEWVRPDHFVHRYVGKDCGREASEVFSNGMEALFGGSFGGLRGAGQVRADREHRDLTLGLLATM